MTPASFLIRLLRDIEFTCLYASLLIGITVHANAQGNLNSNELKQKLSNYTADDTIKVSMLIELASATLDSDFEEAILYARKANELAEKLKHQKIIARSLQKLGDIEAYDELLEQEGLKHLYRALKMYREIKDPLNVSLVLANIGETLSYYDSSYMKGLNFLFDALRIADSIKNDQALAKAANNIGVAYSHREEYKKAEVYFRRSLAIHEKDTSVYGLSKQAIDIGNMAVGYVKLKQYDAGLDYLVRALDIANKVNNERLKALCYVNMASVYLDKNNSSQAIQYADKALPLAVKLSHITMTNLLHVILGKAYGAQGNRETSLKYLKTALDSARISGDRSTEMDVYEEFYRLHKRDRKFEQALYAHEQFKKLSDSLTVVKKLEILARTEADYEAEIRDQKIKALAAENKLYEQQHTNSTIMMVSAIVVASLLAFVFYKRQRFLSKVKAIQLQLELKEQKDRIARDLHDNIGSQLTSLSRGLNRLVKSDAYGKDQLRALSERADDTILELRDTIWVVNKSEVWLTEVMDKINNLVWRLRQLDGEVQITSTATDPIPTLQLHPNVAITLFRVVQEAVNNSLKHSCAKTIEIRLIIDGGKVNVVVKDDGNGFDVEKVNGNNHYGLDNMRKRALEINAVLIIDSQPGKGTEIVLRLPINVG